MLGSDLICTDTDCGVWGWPWHRFAQGKVDHPLFVTSNRCIPVKNAFGWSAVVFGACELLQLFSILFCVVRALHNFDMGLVIYDKKTTSCSDRDSCFG